MSVSVRNEIVDVTGNIRGICSLKWLSSHADRGRNDLYLFTQNTSEAQGYNYPSIPHSSEEAPNESLKNPLYISLLTDPNLAYIL